MLGTRQRLLCSNQQARYAKHVNFASIRNLKRYLPVAAATPPPPPAAAAAAAAAARPADALRSYGRVLFVGGLPGAEEPDAIHRRLAAACAEWQPTHIEVARFAKESERSKFAAGWKHKGHALVAFTSEGAAAAAAQAVSRLAAWGAAVSVGPARKVPPHWPLECTMTPQELAALQQQQAAAQQRRAHNKRQRTRQQQRLIDSVNALLSGLPPPAGRHVLQQYKPLLGPHLLQYMQVQRQYSDVLAHRQYNDAVVLSSEQLRADSSNSSSVTSSMDDDMRHQLNQLLAAMPQRLQAVIHPERLLQLLTQQQQQQQQQHGLIRLAAAPSAAAVEDQLLFDWSNIPAVADPAFGGQLADADVVKAGSGRMSLRALRKRVQVESFALLLLQLTLPALAAGTQLHVVEFGSGSGNLVLPLAHLFPCFTFTAVDMKASAVQLLQQRVQQGGIGNVAVREGTIEMYDGPADVVLALHACGAASDWSLSQAASRNAAFVVSPCCIGKINKTNTARLAHSGSSSNIDSSSDESSSSSSSSGYSSSSPQQEEESEWGVQQAVQIHSQQAVQLEAVQAVQKASLLQYPRSRWLTDHMGQLAAQTMSRLEQQQQQRRRRRPPHDSEGQQQQQQGHNCSRQQQQQQDLEGAIGWEGQPWLAVSPPLNKLEQAVLQSSSITEQCSALFSLLAQAADYSHQEDHSYPDLAALAKSNIEFDRGRCMAELGYWTVLVRLLQPELTAKSDVLVGVPARTKAAAGVVSAAVVSAAAGAGHNAMWTGAADGEPPGANPSSARPEFGWLW